MWVSNSPQDQKLHALLTEPGKSQAPQENVNFCFQITSSDDLKEATLRVS